MAERHRHAGRLGGLATVSRYGAGHMSIINGLRRERRGGRPSWQEELKADRQRQLVAINRARLRFR